MRRLLLPIAFTLLALSGCDNRTAETTNAMAVDTGVLVPDSAEGNGSNWVNPDTIPVSCPAIGGRYVTPGLCENYTRQAKALTKGIAAFDPPTRMRIGAPETITLAIGQAGDVAAVTSAVSADSGGTNTVHTEPVSIGENVSAELSSPSSMFKIAPEGRVVKPMPAQGQQIWQWSIEALVPGKHKLTLTVGVPILGDAGDQVWQPVLEPRTFEIDVQARQRTWPEFFDDMAKFFTSLKGALLGLAAVIGAVAAVWLAVRNFGKKDDEAGKDGAG